MTASASTHMWLVPPQRGQVRVPRGWRRRHCGDLSSDPAAEQAELVALRIGQYIPALVGQAHVGERGARRCQPGQADQRTCTRSLNDACLGGREDIDVFARQRACPVIPVINGPPRQARKPGAVRRTVPGYMGASYF